MLLQLGIERNIYTFGGFRAGGASFFFVMGTPVSNIKFKGRWAQERTLEHYIQECLTFIDLHSLSTNTRFRLEGIAAAAADLVEQFIRVSNSLRLMLE